MRYNELYRALRSIKCYIIREGSRHSIWYSPITGKTFPVSRHGGEEVPGGTLKSIKGDAGLK